MKHECLRSCHRICRVAPHAWSETHPEGHWRRYTYEEILRRESANLDLSWIRDKSLEDSADLEDPDTIGEEIADDLQAALEQFATIAADLRERP